MSDMYERKPQQLTGPDGSPELRVKYIDNGDDTWSLAVGALVLPLPTGAATSVKQDTTNIKLDDLITAISGISGDALRQYKYSDSATVSNVDYVGKLKPDGDWLITRYDANGSALYKIGPAVDYVAGSGFGAWAAGLTGYGTYGDIF